MPRQWKHRAFLWCVSPSILALGRPLLEAAARFVRLAPPSPAARRGSLRERPLATLQAAAAEHKCRLIGHPGFEQPDGLTSIRMDHNMTRKMASPKCNEEIPPCLSVVVPVFNEAASIVEVVRLVLAQRPVQEVIVVDDFSQDDTWMLLQKFSADGRVKRLRHQRNQGKGAALRTGFGHATAPYVLVQDADLEYDPSEYYALLAPILGGRADVVFGSRFMGAGAHRVLYFWHALGNRILTTLSNMATNINISDMETCYKVFRREVLEKITIEEDRFGFEPEITAKISKLKVRIYEVPISYYGRTYAEGKKICWRDGISAVRCIVKYNFCS